MTKKQLPIFLVFIFGCTHTPSIYKEQGKQSVKSNIQDINIITAYKLEESEIQSLTKSIHNTLNTKPKISININSDIIGGITLRIGNKIFDRNHFPNLLENGVEGEGNILVYVNGNSIYVNDFRQALRVASGLEWPDRNRHHIDRISQTLRRSVYGKWNQPETLVGQRVW